MIINYTSKDEVLSWKRKIEFAYQDRNYEVNFYWDAYEGYSCENWVEDGVDILRPDWIGDYISIENPDNTGTWGLYMDLDYLSCMSQDEMGA